MILLETASDGGNPARRVNGGAVRAPHLFEKHHFGTLLGGFERRTHAGKAGADNYNIPFLSGPFLCGRCSSRFGNAGRSNGADAE